MRSRSSIFAAMSCSQLVVPKMCTMSGTRGSHTVVPLSGVESITISPSAWRTSHPNGLSERQLQALSSESLASDFSKPTFDKAPSTFRQAYPNGLSERQLQALSSEASAWHSSPQVATRAVASTNGAVIASMAAK